MKLNIFIYKLFAIIITIGICFVIMEISLRIIGKKPTNVTEGIFAQRGTSYRLAINIEKKINWPNYSYTVYTNSLGFRDRKTGKRDIEGTDYFLVLGNSTVFGNGVNYEETFIGILHEHAKKYDIDVLNLSVGGHHFDDQKNVLRDFINEVERKPSRVLICVDPFLINTFNIGPNNNLIVKSGYLFNKSNWYLPYIKRMLSNTSSVYCFYRDNIRNIQARYIEQTELHVKNYMIVYSKQNQFSKNEILVDFYNYLDEISEICSSNNAIPTYVYLPPVHSYQLNRDLLELNENIEDYDTHFYTEMIKEYCNSRHIEFFNLRPLLAEYYEKGVQLSFKTDAHYNQFTNRIVGEYLIETLLAKSNFENQQQTAN